MQVKSFLLGALAMLALVFATSSFADWLSCEQRGGTWLRSPLSSFACYDPESLKKK